MDLTLILTEDCNLRCTYCYQKHFRPVTMPVEVGIRAICQAIDHGASELSLTFFGGEPLLESETLLEILVRARRVERQRNVPITAKVPTNGTLLTEDFIRRAAELGLFISLSFDGIRPAQNAGRISLDGLGSYDHAEQGLQLLLKSARPFGVYSVITPANVRYLAESRRFLWEQGARILVSAIDYGADWTDRDMRVLAEQIEKLGELYEGIVESKGYSHIEPFDSRISLRTRAGQYKTCCPGIRQLTVGPDGTIYGCTEYFYTRSLPLGDVTDWLNLDQVKRLSRSRAGKAAECMECGVRDRCTISCDCINMRTNRVANQPALTICFTEQTVIQAVDRVASRLFKKRKPGFLTRHYSESYSMFAAVERLLDELEVDIEQTASRA